MVRLCFLRGRIYRAGFAWAGFPSPHPIVQWSIPVKTLDGVIETLGQIPEEWTVPFQGTGLGKKTLLNVPHGKIFFTNNKYRKVEQGIPIVSHYVQVFSF